MTGVPPHILFAWELGANFGHASNVAEVARELQGRARLTVVAKDPVSFRQIAPDLDVDLLPAPRSQPQPPPAADDRALSYSDDLRQVGWRDARDLAALIESWDAIFRLTRPDAIALQAAPTAGLTALGHDAKTAMFGYGYDLPPRTDPLPALFHWTDQTNVDLAAREARVTATANQALAALGRKPIERFRDVLAVDKYLIGCFPEIDPYAPRMQFETERPVYYGQLSTVDIGHEVAWRDGAAHRLFAYLRPAHGVAKLGIEALQSLPADWDCIVSVPGLPTRMYESFARPHLRLFDGPVRLDRLLGDCHVALTHGGGGTLAAFVAAGVPQVCLPTQAEQVMAARALATHGLSLGLVGKFGAKDVRDAIVRVASLPQMRQKARAVAKTLKRDNLLNPGKRIAAELLRLV